MPALTDICASADTLRVMEHDADGHGADIGTAVDHFGVDLASIQVGASQGEDYGRGAFDWWPLTLRGETVGELRDDAAGLTIHVSLV